MAKSRKKEPKKRSKVVATPVKIGKVANFPGPPARGEFWQNLKKHVLAFPAGKQEPWGIPFEMARANAKARAILLRNGDEVSVPVGAKADYVCVLHTFHKSPEIG